MCVQHRSRGFSQIEITSRGVWNMTIIKLTFPEGHELQELNGWHPPQGVEKQEFSESFMNDS